MQRTLKSNRIPFRNSIQHPWRYSDLMGLQDQVDASAPPQIFLSEVAPVITLGRRAKRDEILFSPEHLEKLGIEVCETDRGGFATYHGPGQWVLFLVGSLQTITGDSRGVRKLVDGLLTAALNTCRKWGVQDATIECPPFSGVWTPRGKVVSCGISVKNGVVRHGISLNAYRHPLSFMGVRPCGLDAGPTGNPVLPDYVLESPDRFVELGESLIDQVEEVFDRLSIRG